MYWAKLEQVEANPYQGREHMDQEALEALANDIALQRGSRPNTAGLLQIPAGRIVDEAGHLVEIPTGGEAEALKMVDQGWYKIQLAYGHRRLAAFKLLASESEETRELWGRLPVELAVYSDIEMGRMAWAENNKRQDLTAIEEAIAIIEMMDAFDWTQKQAGRHLGLSQSAISNKIRLLRLPEAVRDKVLARQLSERQALAILPLTELRPEAVDNLNPWIKDEHDKMIANPERHSAEELRQATKRIRGHATGDLSAAEVPTSWELAIDQAPELQAVSCTVCELRTRDGRCEWIPCMEARELAWLTAKLEQASQALGIPYIKPNTHGSDPQFTSMFWGYSDVDAPPTEKNESEKAVELAMKKNCENLYVAICYPHQPGQLHPDIEGGDKLKYLCKHGRGKQCTCRKEAREGPEYQARLEDEKRRRKELKEAREQARLLTSSCLEEGQLWAWRLLAQHFARYHDQDKMQAWDREQCIEYVGKAVANAAVYWSIDHPAMSQTQWTKKVNRLRGIEEGEPEKQEVESSGETQQTHTAPGAHGEGPH